MRLPEENWLRVAGKFQRRIFWNGTEKISSITTFGRPSEENESFFDHVGRKGVTAGKQSGYMESMIVENGQMCFEMRQSFRRVLF